MPTTPKNKGELFLASSLCDGLEDNNIKSTDGMTPVHVAAAWGRVGILELLLANGGDPFYLDDDGRSPFHYAFDGGFYDVISVLGKYCGENAENDDVPKYKIALDKVLINNGEVVAEYVVSDSSETSTDDSYSMYVSARDSRSRDKIDNAPAQKNELQNSCISKNEETISTTADESCGTDDFITVRRQFLPASVIKKKSSATTKKKPLQKCTNVEKSCRTKNASLATDSELLNKTSFLSTDTDEECMLRNSSRKVINNILKSEKLLARQQRIRHVLPSKTITKEKTGTTCKTPINSATKSVSTQKAHSTKITSKADLKTTPKYKEYGTPKRCTPKSLFAPDCSIISKSPNLIIPAFTEREKAAKKPLPFENPLTHSFAGQRSAVKTPITLNELYRTISKSTPRRNRCNHFPKEGQFKPFNNDSNTPVHFPFQKQGIPQTASPTCRNKIVPTDCFGMVPFVPENFCPSVNGRRLSRDLAVKLDSKYDDDTPSQRNIINPDRVESTNKYPNLHYAKAVFFKVPSYRSNEISLCDLFRHSKGFSESKEFELTSMGDCNVLQNHKELKHVTSELSESSYSESTAPKRYLYNKAMTNGLRNWKNMSTGLNELLESQSENAEIANDFDNLSLGATSCGLSETEEPLSFGKKETSLIDDSILLSDYSSGDQMYLKNSESKEDDISSNPPNQLNERVDGSAQWDSVLRSSFESIVSIDEEYRYKDSGKGVVLLERRLCVTPTCVPKNMENHKSHVKKSSTSDTVGHSLNLPNELHLIDNHTLRQKLIQFGDTPGPITTSTYQVYLNRLLKLERSQQKLKKTQSPTDSAITSGNRGNKVTLDSHLMDTRWMTDLEQYRVLEETAFQEFVRPDPSRRWREGTGKTSFNYLLLDSRVTMDLPRRGVNLLQSEKWKIFLSAIFYVGKGKRIRPYSHLYDAFNFWVKKDSQEKPCEKVQKILDIWNDQHGVISLQVFQGIMAVEALTREAAMIDAIGKETLSNCKGGEYYGVSATWGLYEKRKLGRYLLYKAMEILMHEGERQLFPEHL
ncbi:uncharacterized protein LOC105698669 isoform X2 [Orussus abietinus]|uniref:uncharacterized protein LOC105698669 isoform X2 n=1 Tax=Orussus abietinus TaxID=222816 RepID=UPI0006251D56|nr:uncharacterized protein LOC105698669 isoform X2 [Orussus abietinus]